MKRDGSALGRTRTLYRVFGPYLKPYKGRIVAGYAALGVSVAMALLRPWPLKLVLDAIILKKKSIDEMVPFVPSWIGGMDDIALLTLLCAGLVVVVVLESTFGFLQKLYFAQVGVSASTDVLEHVYTHLQTLPRGMAPGSRSGDVIVRLTSDVKRMRDLLVEHVQKLGQYTLTFIATVSVMTWLNWKLTLLGLIVVPIIWYTSLRFSREIRSTTSRKRRKEGDIASAVQESMNAAVVIQAFTQESAERERFRREARESLDVGVESSRVANAFVRSIQVLNTIGAALVIWFGAREVLAGDLSPGDLVVFAAYVTELYLPIQNLSELSAKFMESVVSGERVLDVLETAPLIKDRSNATPAPPFRGDITFDNVVFGYEKDRPVLNGISLEARPGQTVALVGESGTGKSTVLHLLLRFADPWSGRVLIDGHDIRGFRLKSLRAQISVVLQEAFLFSRTVRENIAYGKPHATEGEIIAAAEAAQAHDFIATMPEGYNTMLDERGANLSGGQRQRIALARAFLRNSPILVLDEPTAALDPVTEAQLSETLDELARGRTTIVIAHRLSTVQRADEILVLDRGSVVQRGRHDALVNQPGLYRDMYFVQSQEPEEHATRS